MNTTREVRETRREKVKLLLSLHFPISEIARQLKASRRTITYDVRYIRQKWGEQIKTIDLEQLIAEIQFDLNNRRRELYSVIQNTLGDQAKINAISALGKENDRIIALLQSVGKIDKVPDLVEATYLFKYGDNGQQGGNGEEESQSDGQREGEDTTDK
jgi:transcriptional antiterminator